MVERLFADRADRMGALRRGGADRAHRVAISIAAGDLAFEASSTSAVALRLALLFDDRERVCCPRAPTVGDCDNLVSHAGLRRSSCRTRAGRKSKRGTDDRDRARISWRGDRDAPGSRGASTDRSSRCCGRCMQFGIRAGHPQARWRGFPPTTLAWTQVAGLVFLTPILPWVWKQPGSVGVWVVMAVMGVFGATSHGMLIVAHRYAPAPTLTPFTYTQLIWMIISGILVFGQWPAPTTLVGAALVVACGAYLAVKERKGRPVATAAVVDLDPKV